MTKLTNEQEMKQRFAQLLKEAAEAAELITEHLDNDLDVDADKVNWAHVGTVAETLSQLNELKRFLGIN